MAVIAVHQKTNLRKIAEKLLIKNFLNKTLNADQFIMKFDSECKRYESLQNEKKIDILKHAQIGIVVGMLLTINLNGQYAKMTFVKHI